MAAEGKGRVVHADGFIADVKYKIVNSQVFFGRDANVQEQEAVSV
jgi:hypothetical protein